MWWRRSTLTVSTASAILAGVISVGMQILGSAATARFAQHVPFGEADPR